MFKKFKITEFFFKDSTKPIKSVIFLGTIIN